MFQFEPLPLSGAYLIQLPLFSDDRGYFVKTFQQHIFQQHDIEFELNESYFSLSKKAVIRGMHFQTPPHQHDKIVYCPQGAILDVIIDLRKESATFGKYEAHVLSAENAKAYYIPKGFAHGFKALTEQAITYYLVGSEHSKEHDSGILYNSFGFDWECEAPIISQRDLAFSPLQEFNTPF